MPTLQTTNEYANMRGVIGQGQLRLDQWHHGYLGLVLLAVALWTENLFVGLIGWTVLSDDVLQHTVQWLFDVNYQSPLKVFFTQWVWKPLHKVN